MNDTELNEMIAGLIGWKKTGSFWTSRVGQPLGKLPDFLDDDHLGGLLKLAATLGRWDLYAEPQGDFFAKIELPSEGPDDDPHATGQGFTPSLAVARAIVAHKKGQQAEGSEEPQP